MHLSGSLQRIGDDILPLTLGDEGLYVLPHFPQMKLPADDQPSARVGEQVPLATVYVLGRPEERGAVYIRPLDKQEGALALIRHTVASRLFDAGLLAEQLDFCVYAASQIPVRDLRYPFEPMALTEVRELLVKDLATMETHTHEGADINQSND
jgi:hypothetical protein